MPQSFHAPPPPRQPYRYPQQRQQPVSQASAIANAVDRARASLTGGPGKPMTLPHDFSGFDKTFAPQEPGAVLARHPNIQTTQNPPPTTGAKPAAAVPDVNSAAVQGALNTVNVPRGTLPIAQQTALAQKGPVATPFGSIAATAVPAGTAQPTAAQTAAATTATGVSRNAGPPQWQQDIVKKYPNLAVAGHPENDQFLKEYKSGNHTPQSAMGLADSLFSPEAKQEAMGEGGPGALKAAQEIAGNKSQTPPVTPPTPQFTPGSPLDIAHKAATAVQNAPDAVTAGIHSTISSALQKLGMQPDHAASTAAQAVGAIGSAGNAVREAPANLVGNAAPLPAPMPSTAGLTPGSGKEVAQKMNQTVDFLKQNDPYGGVAQNPSSAVGGAISSTQNEIAKQPTLPPAGQSNATNATPVQSTPVTQTAPPPPAPVPQPQPVTTASSNSSSTPSMAKGFVPYKFKPPKKGQNPDPDAPPMDLSLDTEPNNYAAGSPGVMKAEQREQKAIKRGTGGAKPTDVPELANLSEGGRKMPAVLNSGERIKPTPFGDAVLNRNQQKKPFRFAK